MSVGEGGLFDMRSIFGEIMSTEKSGFRPYVSQSGLKDYLKNEGGVKTDKDIQKAFDESSADALIGGLLLSGMIEPHEHGWVVVDDDWASVLMIRKNGKG